MSADALTIKIMNWLTIGIIGVTAYGFYITAF